MRGRRRIRSISSSLIGRELQRRPPHLEGVRADHRAGDVLAHVRVHPLDDRDDRHEERDGDDDAEQGEERAKLVRSDLTERDGENVGESHASAKILECQPVRLVNRHKKIYRS